MEKKKEGRKQTAKQIHICFECLQKRVGFFPATLAGSDSALAVIIQSGDGFCMRERENTHNSQGVLTGYAIKLISDISGQWERIKMKFMFDIYKFLRSWSSKVGCDSASAPQLLVRQEVNFQKDAQSKFGALSKITASAKKNTCAVFPE